MYLLKNHKKIGNLFFLSFIGFLLSCGSKEVRNEITFHLPEGSECIEIINVDSLKLDTPYMFRELYDGHPALITYNYLTVLDDTLSSPIPLPFGFNISDIHWNEGLCFFSSDSTIYYGENDGTVHPLVRTDINIQSFLVLNGRIIFPADSLLLEYQFGAESVSCLVNAHANISHVADFQSMAFYSSGNYLFLLDEDKEYHIYDAQEAISSFAVHSNGGLFIGTHTGLSYISPNYEKIGIVARPVKDLELIGDDLYVVFEDNSSVLLSNVSNYQKLISKASNTVK